jgi:hypothetical protein
MIGAIEINYISPLSKYIFDKTERYYLVLINTSKSNNVLINKIEIPTIDNITNNIRAYTINKSMQIMSELQSPYYSVRLFKHTIGSNKLSLLFVTDIDINYFEHNNISKIELVAPSKVLGNNRNGIYVDENSFLDEQYNNYESDDNQNKCILFVAKVKKTNKELIKPYIFKFDLSKSNKFVYHRYHNNIIKEQDELNISYLCQTNSFNDYIKLINSQSIDVNRYEKKDRNTFSSMFMRRINLTNFRKIVYNPYLNNTIISPVDSRILGFDINSATKFKFNNINFHYKDLVTNSDELLNGSGFVNRVSLSDYQRFHNPYSAYLSEIGIYNQNSSQYYISLKFTTDYFIPPTVHEREYISVVYGHNIQNSRGYPELVEKQPKTYLVFYLIIFGDASNESIQFTNTKLVNLQKIVNLNSSYKTKKIWIEQGEELGVFNCCYGNVLFMINRPIDFASDIKYYSKLENNSTLYKQIECFVKVNDMIGLIQ